MCKQIAAIYYRFVTVHYQNHFIHYTVINQQNQHALCLRYRWRCLQHVYNMFYYGNMSVITADSPAFTAVMSHLQKNTKNRST